MHKFTRRGILSILSLAVMACSQWYPGNNAQAQVGLSITTAFDVHTPVLPDTPIELRLNRLITEGEGRIAIVIARTDVTSLFVADGTRLTYVPNLIPLPLGKPDVFVFQISVSGEWRELAHFTIEVVKEKPTPTPLAPQVPVLRTEASNISTALVTTSASDNPNNASVTTPPTQTDGTSVAPDLSGAKASASASPEAPTTQGVESKKPLKFIPSLTFELKSQMAQANFPSNTRPAQRATFIDTTVQFSLRSEATRGPVSSQTQIDFAGSSFQEDALRFGTLGEKAPKFDLASYLVQFQIGRAKVALGHTSFGTSRQLIDSFSSRGITVTVPISSRFDFSVAAMNGTSVVGYGNLFGLGKSNHQLRSATIGIELLRKRPGGLRLEFSGLTAYIQSLNNVSQGSVNDVERSKGGSVRLLFTDKSGRLKFDGGFTRSQYRNPADPLLYQGTDTIAVPFLTRNARYLDLSYDFLRNYSLTKTRQLSLSVTAHHEQIDPLFKSLGASTQADKSQNEFQFTGSMGEISVQAGNTRFHDNLRRIPSILKSLTRAHRFSIALPAIALVGGTTNKSPFLPRLSYSFDRTHQFGANIPVNGGFGNDPGLIPDQYNTNQTFAADWQIKKISAGYNYNRSLTDNQQPGHSLSDFRNQTHTARVGFSPAAALNLSFDLTRESASDLERATLNRTWRIGTTATWNVNQHMVWTAGISNTIAGDRARTSDSRNTEFETQFAYRVGSEGSGLKKVQTQIFVRYADRYARQRELLLGLTNLTRVKILNGGLNITFF